MGCSIVDSIDVLEVIVRGISKVNGNSLFSTGLTGTGSDQCSIFCILRRKCWILCHKMPAIPTFRTSAGKRRNKCQLFQLLWSFCWIRLQQMPTIPTSSSFCWKLRNRCRLIWTSSGASAGRSANRCPTIPTSFGIMLDTLPQMPAIPTSSDMLETPQQMPTNPTSSDIIGASATNAYNSNFFGASAGRFATDADNSNFGRLATAVG